MLTLDPRLVRPPEVGHADPPSYLPLGQETWNESLVAGMAQASGQPLLNHLFLKVCLLVAVVVKTGMLMMFSGSKS